MKQFRFSLQAVMTIRVNEEKKALEAFSLAQADYQKALSQQRAVEIEIQKTLEARQEMLRRSANSQDIHQLQLGVRALNDMLALARAAVEKAKAVVDEKSKALLDARQKREVLDKLHEKQFAAYQARVRQAEQKMLDDFATMRPSSGSAMKWK